MKRTEQKVLRFIEQFKLIGKGDKILVAFSGGPDSLFALHFLHKFTKKFKIELTALHFNHGLRGKESDEDEKFSSEYCAELNIPFISKRLKVKSFAKRNKLSIEEAARSLRYLNIEKTAKKTGATKVVTAHNQSDNTETILMNLFSGTGLSGLSGIPVQRENIIRPLLCLSKKEINEYLGKAGIESRIDSSNLNDDFRRNFIRNRILPLIKDKLNPVIDEAVFRSSQNLSNALHLNDTLVQYLCRQFVASSRNYVNIKTELASLFGGEIPGELLRTMLKKNFDHSLEYDDFIKINSLIGKQKGKKVNLSSHIAALRESGSIRIGRLEKASNKNAEIKVGQEIKSGSSKIGISAVTREEVRFLKGGRIEFISADNLGEKFNLRVWNPGDKFRPLGMTENKKVSDFLTDEKIPSFERKNRLVLLSRNQIVWIVGLRIDDRFKLNSKTKKIYKLWVK